MCDDDKFNLCYKKKSVSDKAVADSASKPDTGENAKAVAAENDIPFIPMNVRFVFEVNVSGQWKPLFSLRRSSIKHTIGVFAERQYDVGSPIGYHIGPAVWEADELGTEDPDYDFFETTKYKGKIVGNDDMDVCVFDRDCRRKLVRTPDMDLQGKDINNVYMGLHLLKDVSDYYAELPEEAKKKKAKKYENMQNCRYLEDGLVITLKRVEANDELLLGPQVEDKKPDEDKKPRAKRRKVKK